MAATVPLLAGSGARAQSDGISAGELAACAHGDGPLCLLKLSVRGVGAPLQDEIALAYTPELVRAASPAASPLNELNRLLGSFRPQNPAVITMLRADAAGSAPDETLRLLTDFRTTPLRPTDKPKRLSVDDRINAYIQIVQLADDAVIRGKNHHPSPGLLAAVEHAGCRDLAGPDGMERADEFVAAELVAGRTDAMRACLLAISQPDWRLARAMMRVQLWDQAVAALTSSSVTKDEASPFERLSVNSAREDAIKKLIEARHKEQAVELARIDLESVLAAPDPAPDLKPDPANPFPFPSGVGAATAVRVLVTYGPRSEALGLLERMDAGARVERSIKALVLAGLVVRGWNEVGEPARARSLVADLSARAQACHSSKDCITPAALNLYLALIGMGDGESMPQLGLSPRSLLGGLTFIVAMAQGRRDVLDARLAVASAQVRRKALEDCVGGALGSKNELAYYCLGLAEADADKSQADRSAAIAVTIKAAASLAAAGNMQLAHHWLDHSLALARRSDAAGLDLESKELRTLAIAELREQGRL